MALLRNLPLEERIKVIQAEAGVAIDAMAEEEAKLCPGVPLLSIRNMLTKGRSDLEAFLAIKEAEAAAKERESAA
jgi:hypothetical protein